MASLANEPTGSCSPPASPNGAGETELARVNRALRTLSAGNRTLLRASDEQELLQAMCRVIVETGGYRLAYVAYAVNDERKSLRLVANVGGNAETFDAANFTWDDSELGQTASATAIRTGQPVVGRRLFSDPAYAGPAYATLRANALAERLRVDRPPFRCAWKARCSAR